jgi:TonB family protein
VIIKVRANIDATGKVISAESVSKGDPVAEALAGSAIAAVKRWQFEPAQRGPEKVAGEVVLSFTFRK